MDYLPVFYNLKDQLCLVVGGGEVAARKASLLLQAGAKLRVVAPELCLNMQTLADKKMIEYHQRSYSADDLFGASLVIAATSSIDVNLSVSEQARQIGLPVNVVDKPSLSSFIFPAIIDRSPLIIGISSGGRAPVLVRLLRQKLESTIPAGYGRLAELVGKFRDRVKHKFNSVNERRGFWERVLEGPVTEMMLAGKDELAESLLDEMVESADSTPRVGEVYLVGGGPGDPELLSFKALRLMQQADVVLYDRLVSEEVLALCRRDAQLIHVGKARRKHTLKQEAINDLLVELAQEGKRVLRLKGGDPFVFGRGGEEIEELMQQGIPFQVVPAVTAAIGCAAYAGIPLTHRDYANSVQFVTGHGKDDTCDLPWDRLVQKRQTLVVYMGLASFPVICRELIAHGMPPRTPVAIISKGTTPSQQVVIGTLQTLPITIQDSDIPAPTLTIIGEVVKLHEKLSWFEPKPPS